MRERIPREKLERKIQMFAELNKNKTKAKQKKLYPKLEMN